MFECITLFLFLWLTAKAIGLAFRLTWGFAKIVISILIALAFPIMLICFLFAGSITLLIPVVLIAIAAGMGKSCAS